MFKLAIIHTTPATVDSLKGLAAEMIPGVHVVNLMDDSILPELGANGGRIEEVEQRWRQYAQIAEKLGADCILNACSSIGGLVDLVQPEIGIPIVRIDEAMAEFAIGSASEIGVAATLATTLQPTLRLLEDKAEQAGRAVRLHPLIISAAYRKLMAGDKEGHDQELSVSLREMAKNADIVVLAQASMARVLSRFSDEEQKKFITSPRLGMEKVKRILELSKLS